MDVYGWEDNRGLNNNLFAEISVKGGGALSNKVVKGKIVSYSVSSSNTWESALEGKSADSSFGMTSAILQTGIAEALLTNGNPQYAGKTLVSMESSIQVWRGAEPLQVSLTIEFVAFKNAYEEVELPIQYLHRFISPLLKRGTFIQTLELSKEALAGGKLKNVDSFGTVPFDINLDFMKNRFSALYVLESVNEDVDGVKIDKNGNRIRQAVSLSFKSKRAILDTKDDIHILEQYR